MKKILILILTILFLNILIVYAQDIDIGASAIDRATSAPADYTFISKENPANASGTITQVEIWANTNLSNCEVATFYSTGTNKFSTRDYETIDSVTSGSKKTFDVDLAVEAGDYIGMFYSSGRMERDNSGEGYWLSIETKDKIPCTDTTFTFTADRTISLYGTGNTSSVGIKWNTVTINKFNTIEISKWNTME